MNEFTGTIPASIGDLTHLQCVNDIVFSSVPDLERHGGVVLWRLMLCIYLCGRTLAMEGNKLTGSIPTEIGSLAALE